MGNTSLYSLQETIPSQSMLLLATKAPLKLGRFLLVRWQAKSSRGKPKPLLPPSQPITLKLEYSISKVRFWLIYRFS